MICNRDAIRDWAPSLRPALPGCGDAGQSATVGGQMREDRSRFGGMRRLMKADRQKPTLHRPEVYEIRVPGILGEDWANWFGKISISVESQGESQPVTTLTAIVDQAALHSLLRRLYSLGLPLISVTCVE